MIQLFCQSHDFADDEQREHPTGERAPSTGGDQHEGQEQEAFAEKVRKLGSLAEHA